MPRVVAAAREKRKCGWGVNGYVFVALLGAATLSPSASAADSPSPQPPQLLALFKKYLAREEAQVKDAIAGPVAAMPTKDVCGNFSVNNPAKIKAKAAALKALRKAYPKAFWEWLDQHDDIRMGLYLTAHPTPPIYVANLAQLWKAAGPARADKYAHLLLAAALRPTPVGAAPASPPVAPSPVEQRLAALIRQGTSHVPEPMVFFIHHKGQFQKEAGFTDAQMAAANLETLALLTGTYPQSGGISVLDNVMRQIARLETKVPEADGIKWPLFRPDEAPYYLLNPLTQGLPAAEQDYIWKLFQPRMPGAAKAAEGGYGVDLPTPAPAAAAAGPRILGYGKYGWDYEAPEIRYKKSAWHPNSLPRIVEDGGVCGRMARQEAVGKNTLGIPCCTAGQPTHCALMFISRDGKGLFHADIGQSVTGGWHNTGPHVPVGVTPAIQGFEGTAISWMAMVETANRIKPADYAFSLFCSQAADEAPDAEIRVGMLKAAVKANPYHLGAWAKLVNVSAQMGTHSFNSVVWEMADRLAYPEGKAAEGAPRDGAGDHIMRVLAAQVIAPNYDKMLAARIKSPPHLVAGVRDMWELMDTLNQDGVPAGDGADAVFRKYAALVSPSEAGELFRKNFEAALRNPGDLYGHLGSPLTTAVNSFRDIGMHEAPAARVETLKVMCEKIAKAAPKYRLGCKAQLLYGKTFYLSCIEPNQAYASALAQLGEAVKANGRPDLAQGTLAAYQAEGAHLLRKGQDEDRKRLKKEVLEQIEKLREEDRRRLR